MTVPRSIGFLLVTLAALLVAGGCAPSQPSLESGPDAEITHDGLVRVDRVRRFSRVWLRPGADLSGYRKLMLVDAGVHYRRPDKQPRDLALPNERQLEFMRNGLRDALSDEIAGRKGWEVVEARGPDVLVLRGALIDLFVTQDRELGGRDRYYTTSAGEATLVIELFDSESLEILVRIADRRAAAKDDSSWRNDEITNRAAAKRLLRSWARRLADGLDYARGVTPLELPPANDAAAD
jgi:hypothetical protein